MQVKLKLFFQWGIQFPKGVYDVADKGNRKVSYASKEYLEQKIIEEYSTSSVGEEMTEEEKEQHRPVCAHVMPSHINKPYATVAKKPDEDDKSGDNSLPISENNFSTEEETEIMFNEEGAIIGEKLRDDLPR